MKFLGKNKVVLATIEPNFKTIGGIPGNTLRLFCKSESFDVTVPCAAWSRHMGGHSNVAKAVSTMENVGGTIPDLIWFACKHIDTGLRAGFQPTFQLGAEIGLRIISILNSVSDCNIKTDGVIYSVRLCLGGGRVISLDEHMAMRDHVSAEMLARVISYATAFYTLSDIGISKGDVFRELRARHARHLADWQR